MTYPANKTVTYAYDEVGNRKTMTDPDGGIPSLIIQHIKRILQGSLRLPCYYSYMWHSWNQESRYKLFGVN